MLFGLAATDCRLEAGVRKTPSPALPAPLRPAVLKTSTAARGSAARSSLHVKKGRAPWRVEARHMRLAVVATRIFPAGTLFRLIRMSRTTSSDLEAEADRILKGNARRSIRVPGMSEGLGDAMASHSH